MPHNYAVEGRVRDLCADAGVLATAIDDYIEEFRVGQFDESNAKQFIDQSRETKPHRFAVQGADQIEEAIAAFGPDRTLQAQAAFVRKHGEVRAREVAARFGTTIGGLKAGVIPPDVKEQVEKKDPERGKTSNPWHPSHVDPRTGRYSARALTLQSNAVKAMGAKASALAAVWGAKLGDLRPGRAA